MSSYLDRQSAAFSSGAAAAASKVSRPKTLAAPTSAPSPAASQVSSNGDPKESKDAKDAKRKRDLPAQNIVYSQPADTNFGTHAYTQVTYVIEFLKKKDEPKSFQEILEYLSQMHLPEQGQRALATILRKHGRIEWMPPPDAKSRTWDSGTFKHKPIIAVRSKTDLLAYLQKRADAQGVSVKELKDGWPDCEAALTELENAHKILVTRSKKDNYARFVWANDASLYYPVEYEFVKMWNDIKLPENNDDIVNKLLQAGQKPASEDPAKRVKAALKPKDKKKRVARKGGRTTNTHMQHLLKDYDHMRK